MRLVVSLSHNRYKKLANPYRIPFNSLSPVSASVDYAFPQQTIAHNRSVSFATALYLAQLVHHHTLEQPTSNHAF